MPGTDPSTWSQRMRLHQELLRFQAQGAAAWVDVNLKGVNDLFAQFAELGVALQDDLTKYTEEIYRRIVMRTPVRTGRARAAWHVMPPNTPNDSYQYTVPAGPYLHEARTYDGSLTGMQTGPWDAIIGNNVEYILALEAGHSKQAPQGMVAVTLIEARSALVATLDKRIAGMTR